MPNYLRTVIEGFSKISLPNQECPLHNYLIKFETKVYSIYLIAGGARFADFLFLFFFFFIFTRSQAVYWGRGYSNNQTVSSILF